MLVGTCLKTNDRTNGKIALCYKHNAHQPLNHCNNIIIQIIKPTLPAGKK